MKILVVVAAFVLAFVLAVSGWLVWRKWPLTASDLEKVCRVDEFSGCTAEGRGEFSICELKYFDRALSSTGVLEDLGREASREGMVYGRFLRERAAAEGISSCPTGDRHEIFHDSYQLCSIAALESCLRIDPDPAACGRLDVGTSAGIDIRKKLMETADVRKRADIVQGFATAIRPAFPRCAAIDSLMAELNDREERRQEDLKNEQRKDKVGTLAPAIDGSLDPSSVIKPMRGKLTDLQLCYDKARRRGLTAKGELWIHFTIPPAGGHPRQPEIEKDTIKEATLAACAIKVLRSLSYPAADGPTDVSVGFTFQ